MTPAMAANEYTVSYSWSSGKTTETAVESFQPTNSSTLTYTIIASESLSNIYFIANVTDEDGEFKQDFKPGFKISGYPKTNLVSGGVTVAEIKDVKYDRNAGTLIIPLTNPAQRFSIDLTIESDASTVYHDETNKITAGLYTKVGDDYIPVSNAVIATANNKYPQMSSRGSFELLNPSLMPSGKSDVDLKYVFYTTTDIGSIWNTLGTKSLRVRFDTFTLNFSDVNITSDGVTKNYSQWKADGNSPVTFKNATTGGYTSKMSDDGLSIIFIPNSATYDYFKWNQTFNFSLSTTENFKFNGEIAPKIDLKNLTVSADMKINDRGNAVQFTNIEIKELNNPSYLLPHYTAGTLTGAKSDKLTSVLYAGSNSGLIISNSKSYASDSPFYYQELFKSTFRNTIRDGTDEKLTFGIPDGVAVTHLRIPKSGTEVAMYDAVVIHKDGKTYTISNKTSQTILLSDLKADSDKSAFVPYTSGEDVVLEIKKLILIERSTGGTYSYSTDHTISFIGTTDIAAAGQITFDVSNNYGNVLSTVKPTAAVDYIPSPYLSNTVRYLSNSDKNYNEAPTLVSRGDTFYMYNTFYASSYPYGSALRVSPTNLTGIYPNPVIYFSVPFGLDPGTAQITDSAGNDIIKSGAYKDISGKPLNITQKTYDNAGLYAAQGGKLVEVKIHLKESGKENDLFWINSTARYARLPVTVSPTYLGDSFDIGQNSVLISSWDPNARYSLTGGAGGTNFNFTTNTVKDNFNMILAYSNVNGSYPSYLIDSTVYVQEDATVVSSVGVKIGSDYVYYNPSSSDSYPSLKAGSKNEMFKIYFYNGLGKTVGTNDDPSTIYFILPAHENWRTSLTNVSDLDINEFGNIDEYSIYYTQDSLSYSKIGSYSLGEAAGFNWEAVTDVTADTVDWSKVTAIKCEFYDAEDKSRFEFLLPFELPPIENTVEFNQKAIGQTIYDVKVDGSTVLSSDKSYTAAVLLSPSDPPVIHTHDEGAFNPSYLVDYKTNSLPNWYDIITHDDFTESVSLSSAKVTFKDINGVETETSLNIGSFFNRTDYPKTAEYEKGYKYTINTDSGIINPVTDDKIGNYTIEYKTTKDDESKIDTESFRIQIKKESSTIVLDAPAAQEIYSGDPIPNGFDTWADYFRTFVSGTDSSESITDKTKFVYDAGNSTFDSDTPGNLKVSYGYTDIALNTKYAQVPVTVKYADELVVKAVAADSPVMDLSISIESVGVPGTSSSPIYDIDKNGYNATVYATKTTPNVINYKAVYSNVPAGLIDSNSGLVTGSVTYGVSSPVHNLVFTPAKVIVNLNNAASVQKVSLYQVVDSGDLCLDSITLSGTETLISFETESGWFDDEEYYLVAELFPGYEATGADFSPAGSLIYLQTADFKFDNADAEFDLFVSESTLISGHVWNDINRDSVRDDTEVGISPATVNLLNDGLEVLSSTTTDNNGYYYFIDLDLDKDYFVQVHIPDGFNHISEFKDDQKINGNNDYSSDAIQLVLGTLHCTDIDAGFYSQSSNNGGGKGSATIVPNDSITSEKPEQSFPADNTEKEGFTDTVKEAVKEVSYFPILLVLLLLLALICLGAGSKIYKNRKQ
ncbi:hypothetical protein LJC08_04685 [Methanimicrococcus sp. OttesenSCG-928-J09]|nr:hypothetical protein [Methanimicrococcus sp. OttesenSCG-928-J09]